MEAFSKGLFKGALIFAALAPTVYFAGQLYIVEPSRQVAAQEGVKALIRGERLCQSQPISCEAVFENNREIARRVLFRTLGYESNSTEWEYDPLEGA